MGGEYSRTEEGKCWQQGDREGVRLEGKECQRRRFAALKNVNKAITVLKRGMFKQELAHPRKESLR